MNNTGERLKMIRGIFAAIVVSSMAITAVLMWTLDSWVTGTLIAQVPDVSPVYAETMPDSAASAKAFLAAYPVFMNPRCVNCHPLGDAPLQGNEGRPHDMLVKRGPSGMGKNPMQCGSCHQTKNLPGLHMPPGAPGWELPPEDTPMVFEKKTAHDLCVQMRDPAKNGNRNPMEIVEHLNTPIVLWGWSPGEGRDPVPMAHTTFVKYMTEWASKGASCPD
ncbi:MAG TPA: hypothetical protein VGJ94_13630 [Syntrophorhabdaceae bacterium]